MIPTEKELSEMFLISRTTVRQAITEMVQEGWLYRIKSKGTFVARLKIKQEFIQHLETFNEQIARTGCKPSTELLALEIAEMPERVRTLWRRSQAICAPARRASGRRPYRMTVEEYLVPGGAVFCCIATIFEGIAHTTLLSTTKDAEFTG